MSDIKIAQIEERKAKELSIDYNGFNYLLIFGKYTNGGFFIVTNHGVSGELADSDDTFYNAESIGRELKDTETGKALALVIKEVGYND